MFESFMINTWIGGTIIAIVGGAVGFLVVARRSAFLAHSLPNSAFSGAAGASLVGLSPMAGMAIFSVFGAGLVTWLQRRAASRDVATAFTFVILLALGMLFTSMSTEYAGHFTSLLFGQVLGVSRDDLITMAVLAVVGLAAAAALYRPILIDAISSELAKSRRVHGVRLDLAFALLIGVVTTIAVPIVGALLIFNLLVAPGATARYLTDRPWVSVIISVVLALAMTWSSIALGYATGWPIGFFVGVLGAVFYGLGRWYGRRLGR
ncbi:MAG: metal ABC transporter permease [Gordonia sp. (in: high G+C Gram-positive bacteria)]|uniref:metal ABC transporter permease n=1 Tax=Gordonia sp. (in: high G+C Gram-positive bacteria) TaxID=84139 RepID=UPI0039E34E43